MNDSKKSMTKRDDDGTSTDNNRKGQVEKVKWMSVRRI